MTDLHFVDHRSRNSHRRHCKLGLEDYQIDMDLPRDRSPQQTKSTASPKTPKQWHRRQCPYGFRTRFSRTRENFRYGSEGWETEYNQSFLPRSLTTFACLKPPAASQRSHHRSCVMWLRREPNNRSKPTHLKYFSASQRKSPSEFEDFSALIQPNF